MKNRINLGFVGGFFRNISNAIGSFIKEYDIWFPKLISLLNSISDAASALLAEFGIKTVLLFVAWGISIVVEIYRIELGMHLITKNTIIASLVAVFLPVTIQVIQHMIFERDMELGEFHKKPTIGSLRGLGQSILYRLGLPYTPDETRAKKGWFGGSWVWLPKQQKDTTLEKVRLILVITVILLAFMGIANDTIIAATTTLNEQGQTITLSWYESIPVILSSNLSTFLAWLAVIMTTLCAIFVELAISKYVAKRSHDILTALKSSSEQKLKERNSGFVKTLSQVLRNGDEITKRSNARFYNDLLNLSPGDLFEIKIDEEEYRFFDSKLKRWSEVFNNYQDYREYIKQVNDNR